VAAELAELVELSLPPELDVVVVVELPEQAARLDTMARLSKRQAARFHIFFISCAPPILFL
jgi:hypothetical protein